MRRVLVAVSAGKPVRARPGVCSRLDVGLLPDRLRDRCLLRGPLGWPGVFSRNRWQASVGGRFDLGTPHFDLDRAQRAVRRGCPILNLKPKPPSKIGRYAGRSRSARQAIGQPTHAGGQSAGQHVRAVGRLTNSCGRAIGRLVSVDRQSAGWWCGGWAIGHRVRVGCVVTQPWWRAGRGRPHQLTPPRTVGTPRVEFRPVSR